MSSFAVLNGPNLNLLGQREPQTYGSTTLAAIEASCAEVASELGCELSWFQSNHEGALVDEIQRLAADGTDGVVINAAAYTHTSVAIRDALATLDAPFVEVHISNVHAREGFRAHSYLSDLASGVIVGCGVQGYELAVRRLVALTSTP
ncbi:type II 3-dehydroquinate dehydratase [Luteipulveratus halotolerans]|uniref:3-dehydroquinate dehydratase n=1 Tax=Luteipulveratus halotolerans TaxID=1631356 RepID=A0A0L6CMR1_9MICO|nr:type II 3-dehydroquinate dehydratase [Luteipulveratus halotolerans]KNX35966.1 3-dehydroquinate dehydratase [Luteipulveratus halotolerans]KNX39081.1 3-dehydroquinate dehydratase [Luteipulveratus halotolerans]